MNNLLFKLSEQIYVLVLGLDILANPYQRLKDLYVGPKELLYDSTTVRISIKCISLFFYNFIFIKGTLEAPDDYADEISDECYSLCGHIKGDDSHNFFMLGSAFDCDIRAIFRSDDKKVG